MAARNNRPHGTKSKTRAHSNELLARRLPASVGRRRRLAEKPSADLVVVVARKKQPRDNAIDCLAAGWTATMCESRRMLFARSLARPELKPQSR